MQAYDETPSSIHHWLPIQTYGNEVNKYIDNGPSLITDELGNSYYVSFSPLGFCAPYFFCKLFHLELTINSLYVFNCLLLLLSAIIIGCIVRCLTKNDYLFFFAADCYIFLPEILYTQGIVYWHHSLSQVFLLAQLFLFIKIFIINKNKRNGILICAFFITSFLYPYSEWTGFISNIGFALGIFVLDISIDEHKRLSLSIKSIVYIASLAIISLGALGYYILRFSSVASVDKVINTLTSRAGSRSNAPLIELAIGYKESYLPIISIVAIFMVLGLVLRKYREQIKNIIWKKNSYVIALIMIFPLLENLIMKEHAISYTFDRLKGSIFLVSLLSVFIYILVKTYNIMLLKIFFPIICTIVLACWGINIYSAGKIVHMDEYSDTVKLKEYISENYLPSDSSLLVKEGWRAWGFLQTLYHRNIYCTEIYPNKKIEEIAKKINARYVVTLFSTSGYGDTSCYTKARVEDIVEKKIYNLVANNGTIISKEVEGVYAADITDDNWTNGILNKNTSVILFNNTDYNYAKLRICKKIIVENEEFVVESIDNDSLWIHVYVNRDATICAYPNILRVENER